MRNAAVVPRLARLLVVGLGSTLASLGLPLQAQAVPEPVQDVEAVPLGSEEAAVGQGPVMAPAEDDSKSASVSDDRPDRLTLRPRVAVLYDAGFIRSVHGDEQGDDGHKLRRLLLGLDGKIPGGWNLKFQLSVTGNKASVLNGLVSWSKNDFVVTLGQTGTLQSLEEMSSSHITTFMERGDFTDSFRLQRRLGLTIEQQYGDVLLQGGIFTDNLNDQTPGNRSGGVRVIYLPKLGVGGLDGQLHLGASLHRTSLIDGSRVRYSQFPLLWFTSIRTADTGRIPAVSETALGLEAAYLRGPLHVTAEAFWQALDRGGNQAGNRFFGGFVEAGYFLTKGDGRGYRRGVFTAGKVSRPVGLGGVGAVQLNARYEHLDLNDRDVRGGVQDECRLSLVWIANQYLRVVMNSALINLNKSDRDRPMDIKDVSYFVNGMRFQFSF
jgi:phosphate-selective porin OprO/OprP